MSKQFTLGKNERLKSRKQIEKLFAEGKSFGINSFKVYYLVNEMLNDQYPIFNVQFGVGVSSRNFKKAVDRNRIKRLIREAWRLQNAELKEKLKEVNKQLCVFFIYTGKELPDYNFVVNKIQGSIKKLAKQFES